MLKVDCFIYCMHGSEHVLHMVYKPKPVTSIGLKKYDSMENMNAKSDSEFTS